MTQQIRDFFAGLFETGLWPARWHCGYWSDFHGWLYIISDLAIWVSYFLIPVIIIDYFTKKKKGIKFQNVYFLFAGFILLCGATHFMDAVMFWIPMYRLNALIRAMTAIVSLLTTYYLIKILPKAFLQRTSGELENEIQKRMEVEAKLEAANISLNNFAYMAAHDLQEPVRKVLLFANRLQMAHENLNNDEAKNYIERIVRASRRMQQLTADLLNMALLNKEIEMKSVGVEDAVMIALEDLDLKIREKGASFSVGSLPRVSGNIEYLSQLFFNLIGNSMKFSSRPPVITITGQRLGERVIIEVTDNGIGMEAKDCERIFEAFQRLNAKSDFEGSGIGLAICKKIMDVHHGTISVRSEKGVGSTFTLGFPAGDREITGKDRAEIQDDTPVF